MKHRVHKIYLNTAVLTAATLFLRGVGMLFQVYLADTIGASSLGVHALIMSVYTVFVTLSSGGIRFAVSRLSAECISLHKSVGKTVFVAVLYSAALGILSGALLFFSAPFIAERWIGMTQALWALRALALSLPFISVSAVFGGYFTGAEQIGYCVGVNIFEQIGRIALTVILLTKFAHLGLGHICLALAAASVFGEAVNCILHFVLYRIHIVRFSEKTPSPHNLKRLFSTAMPIAVSAYMRTGLSSLGHILIPKGLRKSGADFAAAFETYGYIHAMTFPLLLFPSALLSALAELIVPRLTAAQAENRPQRIDSMARRAFKGGLIFAAGISSVMFFFGKELGLAVYKTDSVGIFMQIFAPLIPVMYCDMVTDGCLKGLGLHMKAMYINLAEATLNVVLLYALIPAFGIAGYGISIYVCECFNFILSFRVLLSAAKIRIRVFDAVCIFVCAIAAAFLGKTLFSPFWLGIALSLGIYIAALYTLGVLSFEEEKELK